MAYAKVASEFYDGGGREGDSATTVERVSYGSNVGASFGTAAFGCVLMACCLAALFWNERRFVARRSLLGSAAKAATEYGGRATDGRLVRVLGRCAGRAALGDAECRVFAPEGALALKRVVEYYVWIERSSRSEKKELGGSTKVTTTYTYARGWSASAVDSSRFKESSTHRNPTNFPFKSSAWRSTDAKLAPASQKDDKGSSGLALSEELARQLEAWTPLAACVQYDLERTQCVGAVEPSVGHSRARRLGVSRVRQKLWERAASRRVSKLSSVRGLDRMFARVSFGVSQNRGGIVFPK